MLASYFKNGPGYNLLGLVCFATAHRFIQPWRHICKFLTAWCTRISRSSTSNAHRITPSCPYTKQPVITSWTFVLVWVLSRVWEKFRRPFVPYFHVMSVLPSIVTNQSINQGMDTILSFCHALISSFHSLLTGHGRLQELQKGNERGGSSRWFESGKESTGKGPADISRGY